MSIKFDRLCWTVGIILLVGLQLQAQWWQWHMGFRPGQAPPHRVAFSWDMFATQIERCDVRWWQYPPNWSYPLPKEAFHFTQFAPSLEWEIVFDTWHAYQAWARHACQFLSPHTQLVLHCFGPRWDEFFVEESCSPTS